MRASCSKRGLFDGLTCAFMLLLCCHLSTTTVSQKPDSALTVVEAEDGGGDSGEDATVTENEESSDLKVVQPTREWQTLKPGEAVPRGSHVRLNLQTGQREVRQGEEQRKYWRARKIREKVEEGQHPSFSTAELKEALQKMEDLHAENSVSNEDAVRSQYRPLEELKRDMADLDMLVETDAQILSRLLAQFRSTNITTERQLKILLEVEYLVHQVDNAQTLFSMGGLQIMLDCLNSSNYQLQEGSAFVLGSALSSNPVVQVEAVENGTLQRLLTLLATPRPHSVKKKVLFAVASLLRHFPHAQNHFLSHGGLQVLSELFRGEGGEGLRVRIVTLLYDMISEREMVLQAGMEPIPDEAHEERLRQYSRVPLQPQLLEGGWCALVPELLESTEHDWREKTLRTLLAMAPVCLPQYRSDGSLSVTLGALRGQYQELVHTERILGEENGYFGEILDLLDTLEFKLK